MEFQGETKVLLAEKYSFVLQKSFQVLISQNCYKGFEFELLIKMWSTKSWNLCSFKEKKRFCWHKNILWFFSKGFMCLSPKVVRTEFSFIYFSRCGPLRAGICGFSGRNEGSAGIKRFYYSSAKLSCAMIPKLSLSYLSRCGLLRTLIC
jgi:hypothetical protein